jgi:molecular chaperone DnaK
LVEDALKDAKDALAGDDADRIRHTSEALVTASQKFAEVLYQKAQTEPSPDSVASSADDVVDAEVVDDGGEQQSA